MNVERQQSRKRSHSEGGVFRCWAALAAPAVLLLAAPAFAQEERTSAPSLPDQGEESPPPTQDRMDTLEERIGELNQRLRESEEARQKAVSPLSWNGYVDFGFFIPNGNRGMGLIRDDGHAMFPQYSQYSWVFLGDILGTAINTRGEPADLGAEEATGLLVPRYDGVNSDGAASFILNEINIRPRYQLSDNAIMRASINFAPRTGSDFALGDTVDADLAELEYLLTKDGKTSVFAGKVLPVFGIEYKERKSDQRFGITPSLMARYTTGSQLGLKVRSKLANDWLVLAASVTNGSSTIEMFHFYNEIDKNNFKTLNGRAAISIPVGLAFRSDTRLEFGASGEYGAQDRATNTAGKMWFAGFDMQLQGVSYALKGQLMQGRSPGREDQGVWGLDLKWSGYLEFNWQVLAQFGFLLRAEYRDAIVTLEPTRLYLTKQRRYTAGVRFVVNPHTFVKLEYVHNDEYGGIAEFRNNIWTSSLVLAF
jgi:hypothetical protein